MHANRDEAQQYVSHGVVERLSLSEPDLSAAVATLASN